MNRSKTGIAFSRSFDVIGPGSIRITLISVSAQFQPQSVGQSFDRVFRGHIGAAPRIGDQSQNRGILNDSPVSLRPHHRNHLSGQLMPAKDVGFKDVTQPFGRHIFDRAGQTLRAVVEQRIQRSARGFNTSFRPDVMLSESV